MALSPPATESPVAETVKHCEERIWFPALHLQSHDLKQNVKRVKGNWPPGANFALYTGLLPGHFSAHIFPSVRALLAGKII